MIEFLVYLYPWTKVLHVFSVITWMAGLFYLPRLFVYHAERGAPGTEVSETFKIMERRLDLFMRGPMIASWFFGLCLIATPGIVDWTGGLWIYPKLAAVFFLTWYHHWCSKVRKNFSDDLNTRTSRYFRIMNEIPALALVVIVVMAVARPI
ncbi:CopD family protein [Amaricoccus tamworthensis]|uniref:CopD family protein n=1 Tax=Amaricoccus tamworthensis TaxID=57002 RepID=UPI003C7A99C8